MWWSQSKKASKERVAALWLPPCSGRSMREASIGVRVSAMNPEISTATATQIPNSLNNRPTLPVRKATGTNTATRVMVVAMTANPISSAPSKDALRRSLPISMCR